MFKEFVFPSCPKCRAMRIAMCIAALVVVGTYCFILMNMDAPYTGAPPDVESI